MTRKPVAIKIVELGEVYKSVTGAALAIHGDQAAISNVLAGRRKTHKGYTFEYVEGKK